jgi:hypothetical protein
MESFGFVVGCRWKGNAYIVLTNQLMALNVKESPALQQELDEGRGVRGWKAVNSNEAAGKVGHGIATPLLFVRCDSQSNRRIKCIKRPGQNSSSSSSSSTSTMFQKMKQT